MSYASIAHDLIFKSVDQGLWESYPYESKIGGAGDLHYFKKPGTWEAYEGKVPRNFVKLNIRDQLEKFYPGEYPNMGTIGCAVSKVLAECGVKNYISAEDRGWEASDFWATLEAVFIPKEEYERVILTKIKYQTEKILNKNEELKSPPLKKQKTHIDPQAWQQELECPLTHKRMKDPVIGSDGHTYERSAIEKRLAEHGYSPLTNEKMQREDLRPNLLLKKMIELYSS